MYAFAYHRPDSLDEARALMAKAEDGRYLAGGQTLLASMKLRLAGPSDLIDLVDIEGLSGLRDDADTLTVGALTPHVTVETEASIPALAALAGMIGDPQVRNRGTMGGAIAKNDPAADYPAALLCLGAKVITDRREIAADDFFVDIFETALDEDEIVTAVRFPRPARAAYVKFPNPGSRFALVGVMVADTGGGPRVAVTGAGACVFRVPAMEEALAAKFSPAAISHIKIDDDELNDDMHAAADYRAELVAVLARRAVAGALGERPE